MRPLAILVVACAASTAALAQQEPAREEARAAPIPVTWNAPEELRPLYQKFIPPPQPQAGERRAASLLPWEREVRKRVPEIAAAEGWFSTAVAIDYDGEARTHVTVTVTPGPRTTVETIDIQFQGDLAGEGEERDKRRRELRESWTLKQGQPFRSADWDVAKTRIEESLTDLDYAAGHLAQSKAEVDAEAAKARLSVVLDSGPRFTLGTFVIEGLERYPDAVVKRLVDIVPGERYSRERLLELQHRIQTGPWFSSVVVETARDPMKPNLVPVTIAVSERPTREVGLALGYGTDDGARGEAAFRHRNLLNRGLDLQSSMRVSQKQQIGYADVYLPPGLLTTPKRGDIPFTDSFGVLAEHSTIQLLAESRVAVAGYRLFQLEKWELRVGLSYQVERTFPEGADVQIKRALAPVVAVTVAPRGQRVRPAAAAACSTCSSPRARGRSPRATTSSRCTGNTSTGSRSAPWTRSCCAPSSAAPSRPAASAFPRTSSSAPAARAPTAATRTRASARWRATRSWAGAISPRAPPNTCTG